jgi:potassium-transporting ATPase KdpC subunit
MDRLPSWIRQHIAALRMLLVFTVVVGAAYPLVVYGIGQIPGLQSKANGSSVSADGREVGSARIGQSFTDKAGNPIPKYFQSRPSAAGDGYDPHASSASNLGPENIVDSVPDPTDRSDTGTQSLLTQVCSRSVAVGKADGVDGSRPFCTTDGVGAVLSVIHSHGTIGPVVRVVSINQACPARPFRTRYDGVRVECARFGEDYRRGVITPVRGDAPENPAVPADAVTASGSGLDPEISPAYAAIQVDRVARARGLSPAGVRALVRSHTRGRGLGFLGEPGVNVVQLNLALDALRRG